jgi:hypothetical protein
MTKGPDASQDCVNCSGNETENTNTEMLKAPAGEPGLR